MRQGDIWWADLPAPTGSGPGFRRPVVVVQCDAFNESRIATVVCVVLTSNLLLADAPGNVLIPKSAKPSGVSAGLAKDSVANVSQIVTLDRSQLTALAGRLTKRQRTLVLAGIGLVISA
ncbi:MAG: type II toxin-antitoxin system PemK/MazF family toxin [Acidobacteria bacterium]|nr:type II toxin-antitoxin system PemK/MazF family toxin [Acidobacteriota bacterium]